MGYNGLMTIPGNREQMGALRRHHKWSSSFCLGGTFSLDLDFPQKDRYSFPWLFATFSKDRFLHRPWHYHLMVIPATNADDIGTRTWINCLEVFELSFKVLRKIGLESTPHVHGPNTHILYEWRFTVSRWCFIFEKGLFTSMSSYRRTNRCAHLIAWATAVD